MVHVRLSAGQDEWLGRLGDRDTPTMTHIAVESHGLPLEQGLLAQKMSS